MNKDNFNLFLEKLTVWLGGAFIIFFFWFQYWDKCFIVVSIGFLTIGQVAWGLVVYSIYKGDKNDKGK